MRRLFVLLASFLALAGAVLAPPSPAAAVFGPDISGAPELCEQLQVIPVPGKDRFSVYATIALEPGETLSFSGWHRKDLVPGTGWEDMGYTNGDWHTSLRIHEMGADGASLGDLVMGKASGTGFYWDGRFGLGYGGVPHLKEPFDAGSHTYSGDEAGPQVFVVEFQLIATAAVFGSAQNARTELDFVVTDPAGVQQPLCEDGLDPFGVGASLQGDFVVVKFRATDVGPADPIDPLYPHCVVWVDAVGEPEFCRRTMAERDADLTGYVATVPSIRHLGTHWDADAGESPSIAVVGLSCSVESNLNGTSWNDLISSSESMCPAVEHWEDYAGGAPPVGLSGASEVVSGAGRQVLTGLSDSSSGLRYLETAPPPVDEFVYVALGDSFASGEGSQQFTSVAATAFETGENYPGSFINDNTLTNRFTVGTQVGNACHRSLINYAKLNLLRFEPDLPSVLVDRTCSGAKADPESGSQSSDGGPNPIIDLDGTAYDTASRESLLAAPQTIQAAWVLEQQGLTGDDVDLVTVSMGGNDAKFAKLIQACIASNLARRAIANFDNVAEQFTRTDLETEYILSRWISCQALDPSIAKTAEGFDKLLAPEEGLDRGYRQIEEHFPNAEVLQVNYPALLPAPDAFPGETCSGINHADAAYALSIADQLNSGIDDRVASILADPSVDIDLRVVDIESQFGTNPLCPASASDAYFVSIPDHVARRLAERLLDPDQAPGVLLASAKANDTIAACVTSFVPGNDCYVDEYLELYVEWFHVPENMEIVQSYLSEIDDGVPDSLADAAHFENFRTLFHPNAQGFEVIACTVLETYSSGDPSSCKVDQPSPPSIWDISGTLLSDRTPIAVAFGQTVDFAFDGWAPGSALNVTLHSDPVDVGTFTADGEGVARSEFVMPEVAPGVHRVVFDGTSGAGNDRQIEVLLEVEGQPVVGTTVGIFESGFAPYESVDVRYMDVDYGSYVADVNGDVFFELVVPAYAAVDSIDYIATGADSGVSVAHEVPEIVEPVAIDDTGVLLAGETIDINVIGNDEIDVVNPGSLVVSTHPTLGTAQVNVDSDGPYVVYQAGNTEGTDIFAYEVCDTSGLCATASVTVEVLGDTTCTISGTSGDDVLRGTPGPDVICGLGGADQIKGLGGDDLILGGPGDDTIDAGAGDDKVFGGRGSDTINGGRGDDDLRGNRGADIINGDAGNDVVRGGRGADTLHGGNGNDSLFTGRGSDEAHGGNGDDTIRGFAGVDVLSGGRGDDHMYGGRGSDSLAGGAGNDVIYGRRGADTISGGSGNDELYGNRGSDILKGGQGNDLLFGGRGVDTLNGGAGSDSADGGRGSDSCAAETRVRC